MKQKVKDNWTIVCILICTICIIINLLLSYPKAKAWYAEYKSPYYEKLDDGFTMWKDVDKLMNVSCKSQNGQRVSYFIHMPDSFYMQPHEYQLKVATEINESFKKYAKTNNVYIKDRKRKVAFGWVYITPAEHYDFIVEEAGGKCSSLDYKDIDYVTATYKYFTKDDEHTMYNQRYAHDKRYKAKLDSIKNLNKD